MWLLMYGCLALLSATQSQTDLSTTTTMMTTMTTTTTTVKVTTKKSVTPKRIGGTDSPMLNYIFDSHSSHNKHQHYHDHRWGPHFEGKSTNITAQAGANVTLDCRISLLQDKTVSWVRRQDNGEKMNLLTVGQQTYTGDSRYTVEFQYPDNWRLQIKNVNSSDEGQYECQISTHPPKFIHVNLHINAPSVRIIDAMGEPLRDKYYEADSTIELLCVVRHIAMQMQYSVVQWLHGNRTLNYDTTRGGISVKTNLMEEGANSTLSIARVGPADSGNYTCALTTMPDQPATVHVHVLNGESLAELHHGRGSSLNHPRLEVSGNSTLLLLLGFLLAWNLVPR
ncbi:titin homolog isoform X1 [Nasonia vitripennis]|uniref:Ig-like domain-containing protein n=2 Tax=Nasonia vitripennis TaxID=7425 RepID=A0A7M7Q1Q6_NASVI|nr:titin homolog isoform X1 [Nasonia vitripennis]XP_031780181.1 titin homolog isoform X1 [Nasonia vitripennis]XP_031780182.1 titin homolog isoform X1 [Nasonia vitripennis]XP_031780183.1 titin homolog isoform X1 [Nasonia vitripennis]XP_031780184.1 titin homolog isoform X1 [Nasonia vitripennis]